jgi:hypothetical protein
MSYNPGQAEPKQAPCAVRERMLDKTIADSFPTSDPPSSIPDPTSDSFDAEEAIQSPYDLLTRAENKDAEHQPQPGKEEEAA